MDRKRLEEPENPDIDFIANLKARELRFDKVPETKVRFRGDIELDCVSGTERKNLPEEVRRGVTYHDVSVRLRIASELADTVPDLGTTSKEEKKWPHRHGAPEASDLRAEPSKKEEE